MSLPRLDRTGSDFDSLLEELKADAASLAPGWDTENVADPAVALLHATAYVGDRARYYQDAQTLENYLITAVDPNNVIRILRMLAYRLAPASAAQTTLTFTITSRLPIDSSLVFDVGDVVSLLDGSISGELSTRLEILPGSSVGTATWVEGSTVSADLGNADGSQGFRVVLLQTPFLEGSEILVVDGVIWTRVDDFLSSSASDRVYVLEVDGDSQATVAFGDGINGAIPAAGADLVASYRIGGGSAGSVGPNTLKKLARSYATAAGTPVTVSVTNAAAAIPGTDRESIDHAKVYGPRVYATQGRCVSKADYETVAMGVAGVARALAQTSDDDPTLPENTTLVSIVPTGAGAPTQQLLDAVRDRYITGSRPKTMTSRVMVAPALYVDVSIVGTLYLSRLAAGQSLLLPYIDGKAAAIMAALVAAYDPTAVNLLTGDFQVQFGQVVALSSLYVVPTTATPGVALFDITSPTGDRQLAANYFPRLRGFAKSIIPGPPILVRYTWTGLGASLDIREAV